MLVGYSRGSRRSREGKTVSLRAQRRTYFETEDRPIIGGKRLFNLLNRGADYWNRYRSENVDEIPHFNHVTANSPKLDGYNLSNANFVGAQFTDGSFNGTNLMNIDAKSSQFENCDFTSANLRNANFFASNFNFCQFVGSDLQKSYLVRTLLRHCNLTNSKLNGAEFGDTDFLNTTFKGAVGLSSTYHEFPSRLDTDTLQEKLPLAFLRGVGLPDKAIKLRDLLAGKGAKYHSCFISYSTADQKFADCLYSNLQDHDVRCWFAPHDLPVGAKTLDEIDLQITERDKLLIILSKNSLQSEWVEDEVHKAFAEERRRRSAVLRVRLGNQG